MDIVNATQEALKIAEEAQRAAQNATDMVYKDYPSSSLLIMISFFTVKLSPFFFI